MPDKLAELLRFEGPALSQEFAKASVSGRGTPQEVADARENALRHFMGRYFPFPFKVAKGNIVDAFGSESDSIDCVLVNPAHPHTIDALDRFTVLMVDAIDAAIELKPDLQSHDELIRGLVQTTSVKRLMRTVTPLLLPARNPKHVVEDSRRAPCFLFTEKVKTDPLDTIAEIVEHYRSENTPVIEQVDFVVVNGQGIISNYKYPERTMTPGRTGFFWEEWQENTVAAFLFKICWCIPSVAPISEPVLQRYLRSLRPKSVKAAE